MAKKAASGAPKKPRAKKKKDEAGNSKSEKWQTLQEKVDAKAIRKYVMSEGFVSQNAIQHPKFGLGVVTTVFPNKIEVEFEDGPKLLVHNHK